MTQYIDKSALVAEIRKRLLPVIRDKHYDEWEEGRDSERIAILDIINSLEVKEVNLEKEVESLIKSSIWRFADKEDFLRVAKHFFELGLKTQHSSISIPDIDDLLEEEGVVPTSKEAKIFKESYYMALEKLKEKKGE